MKRLAQPPDPIQGVRNPYAHDTPHRVRRVHHGHEVEADAPEHPTGDASSRAKLETESSSAARSMWTQAEQVADATGKGARVLVGGGQVPGKGWYFPPTVLTGVDHSMAVMSDESFGPVVGIQVTCPPYPPPQSRCTPSLHTAQSSLAEAHMPPVANSREARWWWLQTEPQADSGVGPGGDPADERHELRAHGGRVHQGREDSHGYPA